MKQGLRYITKEQADEINTSFALKQKALQAHRWLAEFDDVLNPLWSFLFRENTRPIDEIREEMRKKFQGV